jgi:glutamine amidotransferase
MQNSVVVVDYGMGNLRSVEKKLQRLGIEALISGDAEVIRHAAKLILPGVGHFANGVKSLRERGLWDVIDSKVRNEKTPIMGICLGMQLMAKFSEEGNIEGFGWFDADVKRFRVSDTLRFKVPHMGWNESNPTQENLFTEGLSGNESYYFVHAYHLVCNNPDDVLGKTVYDYEFVSMMGRDNIIGVQFHPEKSHGAGDRLFQNFINL